MTYVLIAAVAGTVLLAVLAVTSLDCRLKEMASILKSSVADHNKTIDRISHNHYENIRAINQAVLALKFAHTTDNPSTAAAASLAGIAKINVNRTQQQQAQAVEMENAKEQLKPKSGVKISAGIAGR